jgi:hypothetical protein
MNTTERVRVVHDASNADGIASVSRRVRCGCR